MVDFCIYISLRRWRRTFFEMHGASKLRT